MLSKLDYFIFFFSMGIVFCPLLLSLIDVRSYPKELKIIPIHLTAIAILGVYGAVLWVQKTNNLPILHVYTMIEFSTITLFYQVIFKETVPRHWFLILISCFIVFCLINALYIQSWQIFNTYPRTLESITVIGFSLCYYYRITHQNLYLQIEKSPIFWINTGLFIYFSGGFLLFTLSNYILPLSLSIRLLVWQLHALLSIIMYVLIFIGLWQHRKA